MSYLHLTPAYGRDYASRKALLADFDAQKDFMCNAGPVSKPINKQQIPDGTKIQFRFGRNLKVFCHIVKGTSTRSSGVRTVKPPALTVGAVLESKRAGRPDPEQRAMLRDHFGPDPVLFEDASKYLQPGKPLLVEVIADHTGNWVANSLRFVTVEEAKAYGADLFSRWMAVRAWRVRDEGTGEVHFLVGG